MAVAHRASATMVLTTGTTGGTIVIPASVVAGDDLYVMIVTGQLPTCVDDDAGGNTWALLGASADTFLNLFWKKATSGSASKTVTLSNGLDTITGGLSAFSGGLAAGDPTTNLALEANIAGNEVHIGFTPTHADSMICLGVTNFEPINVVTLLACTNPGSLEPELWERSSTGGGDCYAIFGAVIQAGGPTATGNFTWAQTNSAGNSLAFAIRPEVAAAGGGSRNRLLLGVG